MSILVSHPNWAYSVFVLTMEAVRSDLLFPMKPPRALPLFGLPRKGSILAGGADRGRPEAAFPPLPGKGGFGLAGISRNEPRARPRPLQGEEGADATRGPVLRAFPIPGPLLRVGSLEDFFSWRGDMVHSEEEGSICRWFAPDLNIIANFTRRCSPLEVLRPVLVWECLLNRIMCIKDRCNTIIAHYSSTYSIPRIVEADRIVLV